MRKKKTRKKKPTRKKKAATSGEGVQRRHSSRETQLAYVNAYGNITKLLDKIKKAATPSRFTHDFLSTKLGLTGGSARPLLPFLKRIGFIGSDGSPTDLYERFRNSAETGYAAAGAIRKGFAPLYEMNEYTHDLSDANLKGLIVQATGLESTSGTVRAAVGSFKALRAFASFDARPLGEEPSEGGEQPTPTAPQSVSLPTELNLGYTINLHLPATSDIAVFNAIFKSLREHLIRE